MPRRTWSYDKERIAMVGYFPLRGFLMSACIRVHERRLVVTIVGIILPESADFSKQAYDHHTGYQIAWTQATDDRSRSNER